MPLQQTSGNVTQDAYGGGKAVVPVYVESVFSTYLYTGTGATRSITNNIDLADNGGLVWIKNRTGTDFYVLTDTARGINNYLYTNTTGPQSTASSGLTAFNTNGFTVGSNSAANGSGNLEVSWTFRKQPKFFDIVTYTGTGSAHTIAHNLGVAPGCIIVKRTDTTGNWQVYHSGLTSAAYSIQLNLTNAQASATTVWNSTAPTSSVFSVGTDATVNASGGTYIAYIFGPGGTGGFGLTGTQDIISCGSYTGTGVAGNPINLGYEPQWILLKNTTSTGSWVIYDVMRGFSQTQNNGLDPNLTSAEGSSTASVIPTATGFQFTGASFNSSGAGYIYIAIRRGPMAVPTTGTSVFSPNVISVSGSADTVTTNFVVDLSASSDNINSGTNKANFIDRLRGSSQTSNVYLTTSQTNSETSNSYGMTFDNNTGYVDYFNVNTISSSSTFSYWNFARAPGFFDIVCYTGTGSAGQTFNHNLGVVPELMIVKDRSQASLWLVYSAALGNTYNIKLNTNAAAVNGGLVWNNTSPTSTQFTLGSFSAVNGLGDNYVNYLFATCAGVSKVGSYTGNGTGQSIACGFGASGARFILAKATSTTGDWYVFDSANGLTSSSSPYLTLDTTNAQVTGNNGVYASSGGFTLTSNASSTVNVNGVSYIFLAVS